MCCVRSDGVQGAFRHGAVLLVQMRSRLSRALKIVTADANRVAYGRGACQVCLPSVCNAVPSFQCFVHVG